ELVEAVGERREVGFVHRAQSSGAGPRCRRGTRAARALSNVHFAEPVAGRSPGRRRAGAQFPTVQSTPFEVDRPKALFGVNAADCEVRIVPISAGLAGSAIVSVPEPAATGNVSDEMLA